MFIALLSFILLFSISCESNEESSKPPYKPPTPKHELEGIWVGYDEKDKNYELKFTVDSDGNITFYPKPFIDENNLLVPYSYTGKVETNAITYPYTTKLSNYIIYKMSEPEGIFTFNNSSNCTASYTIIYGFNSSGVALDDRVVNFTKQ